VSERVSKALRLVLRLTRCIIFNSGDEVHKGCDVYVTIVQKLTANGTYQLTSSIA